MIVQETMEGNDNLVKTYSDAGMMIRKIGTDELYSEAIDPKKFDRRRQDLHPKLLGRRNSLNKYFFVNMPLTQRARR